MPRPTDNQHWSASRFMLFESCPEQYRARYVDGVVASPSLAMLFGHTVHTALERLLQGPGGACPGAAGTVGHVHTAACGGCPMEAAPHEDHLECARAAYWREFDLMRSILDAEGVEAGGVLYLEGLRMIDQVAELRLNGDGRCAPERWFTIPGREAALAGGWPIVGAVDLWCPPWSQHGAVVFDFKTTMGKWSAERAQRERWQPLLYAWAYDRAYGQVPTFRYLVLNRATSEMAVFDRGWRSRREFEDDLVDLRHHMAEIAEQVAARNFDCAKRHGSCLECGESYTHGHQCRRPARHKITLTRLAAS